MFVESTNESAARLPQEFSRMDIKDLLVSKPSPHLKGDRRLSAYSQPDSPPRRPRAPSTALDFPLPSTNPGHPILPSPAPTISYAPEGTYRHLSPPYHLKAECPEYLHHPWDRHTPHSNYFSNYQNHEHSIHYATPPVSTYSPSKRALSLEDPNSKRQKKGKGPNQKWDAEEDARIIELRGSGMKWGDISKNLPGRTEIACRLHYQNYLEKRGQWDEEKKTKLARVYDRMKAELWQPLANELGVPWRSAEAMHWILGEREMARRANTVPFAMVSGANTAGPQGEGNGRIAQTNRMHDSTIYFEPSDVAALQTTHQPDVSTPASIFGQHDIMRAKSKSGSSGGSGSDDYATEGAVMADYDGDNDSLAEEPQQVRRVRVRGEPTKLEGSTNTKNEEEGWRLPGLADLDSRISAYVGHGSKAISRPGSSSYEDNNPKQDSNTGIHNGSNGSSHGSHRNSNGSAHNSQHSHSNGHHLSTTTVQDSKIQKSSSHHGSDDGGEHSNGTSGTDGYVQIEAQGIAARKFSGSKQDHTA